MNFIRQSRTSVVTFSATDTTLEAYIRAIDQLKVKSGLTLDGDSLVNRAAAKIKRQSSSSTLFKQKLKDEQKGTMFLFKGVVGLRNSKAHSNRLFNDPR